jgi:hypothetical protein
MTTAIVRPGQQLTVKIRTATYVVTVDAMSPGDARITAEDGGMFRAASLNIGPKDSVPTFGTFEVKDLSAGRESKTYDFCSPGFDVASYRDAMSHFA